MGIAINPSSFLVCVFKLERFTSRTKNVHDLVLNHFFHHRTSVAKVLTGVEVARGFVEVLSNRRRERYAKVGVDIDFANCHLSSFSKFAFGDTDSVGHVSAELVNDSNLVLGNGRRAVKNDGEAGQSLADFF